VRILALILFIPLQLAILPLAIVGVALVIYKQMVVSRRLGVSQTGIEVMAGRWTMHIFGMRNDPATAKLASALPNYSPAGMWLALFPLWLMRRVSGQSLGYPRLVEPGTEDIRDLVTSRTVYIDSIVTRALGSVHQVVLMGAGYDTRAYGNLASAGREFFELDQQATQDLKKNSLEEAGVSAERVTFVSVDFREDDVFEKLRSNGYDGSKPTLFLWEGVTLYLPEVAVRQTLRDIKAHSAPGSVVVADLYGERLVRWGKKGAAKKTLAYTDEPFGFSLPFDRDHEQRLETFIESEELRVGETYFMGTISKKGPYMVVAELLT
jgi:methyltransferase (TIGR00027 family)